jgi:hypothetical protein
MDHRIFNLCLLVGWAMFLAGGIVLNIGWGILAGGALLLVLTIAGAVFFGVRGPKARAPGEAG